MISLPALLPLAMSGGYSIENLAIGFIILIAVIAVVCLYVKVSGVPVPPWLWQLILIVVGAILCIAAIHFIVTM